MYPPVMRRLASKTFTLILILLVSELFFLTSASFFVEITQKRPNGAILTLYECNAEGATYTLLDSGKSRSPERVRRTEVEYNQDMICNEVKDKRYRKKIYSWVNFLMVADGALNDDKKIYLQSNGKKGSGPRITLGAASPNLLILFGAVIMKPIYDVPVLQDVSENHIAQNYLYSEIKDVQLIMNAFSEDELKEFLVYLSMEDYHKVLKPKDEDVKRFKLYGKVVSQIESMYASDVRDAKKNNVAAQNKKETVNQIASAARILILKLADPCLFMAGVGGYDAPEKKVASSIAKIQCNNYCKFLAAGFQSHEVTSSRCNGNRDRLVRGFCDIHRCYCEKKSYMMRMPEPERYYTMIECSNDLRIKTAAAMLKTPSLASMSSIRKSFSRRFPTNLWRSPTKRSSSKVSQG